jgi:hypothetical protein
VRSHRRDDPPTAQRAYALERVTIVVPADVYLSSLDWVFFGHLVQRLRAERPANDPG